jgi:DNA-binding helix-hairpin-helix protein with protein kinase domain
MPPTLYDPAGAAVVLGSQLAEGGEGVVYTVVGDAAALVKVYKKRPGREGVAKLRALTAGVTPGLAQVAAWPAAVLAESPGGPVVGFRMLRFVGYEPAHHLYNPRLRERFFPRADWRFLAHAARNVAAAFEEVHRAGCVVGDVNQSNVLVAASALAALIDCDSFQVSAGGRVYRCGVGVSLYTPPELQDASFAAVDRTTHHDGFGLAVLLFQFLVAGRHPFAGVYSGAGEPSFEDHIKAYRFAYSSSAAALGTGPPPFVPGLAALGPELAGLFERAFGPAGVRGRPSAGEWVAALDRFRDRLSPCPAQTGHLRVGNDCPWCAVVRMGGPDYFASVAVVVGEFVFAHARFRELCGLAEPLLAEREDLPDRDEWYATDGPRGTPPPPEDLAHLIALPLAAVAVLVGGGLAVFGCCYSWVLLWAGLLLVGAGVVGVLVASATSAWVVENDRRSREMERTGRILIAAEDEWRRLYQEDASLVAAARQRFESLRSEGRGLSVAFRAEREGLRRNARSLGLGQYLAGFPVADAGLAGIGAGRAALLSAHGIDTAADVTEEAVCAVRGFGPALTRRLVEWRLALEKDFRPNAEPAIPEADLRVLSLRFRQRQDRVFANLKNLADRLRHERAALAAQLDAARDALLTAREAWGQARADAEAMGG